MRIVVVGGGIAGLAAAYRLVERGAEVVVVEQAARLGGKLRTEPLGDTPMEDGAEAFLVRDPDGTPSAAIKLARAVGLDSALTHPAVGRAALAVGGSLRPLPGGTLMGVPGDLSALDGVAEPATDRDHDDGRPLLRPGEDVAVGALVRRRLGDQVADRLVDPLLGGVYAGRADDLSLETTMPALAEACRREHTLTAAVRAALAASPARRGGPVFATIVGGMSRLVEAVARRLDTRLGLPVRSLAPAGTGWRLLLGSVPDPRPLTADAVVLAVPARPAARLLAEVDAGAAAMVGALDYASVALVSLVLPPVDLPDLSGFLVPATEGYAVKAATFFDRKWDHLRRPDRTLVRVSLGRYGESDVLRRPDAELVSLAVDELGTLLGGGGRVGGGGGGGGGGGRGGGGGGRPLPAPLAARVRRWGGALPQYAPGHLDRVAAARARLPGTVVLAGAAYDRVGIPACIRSGWAAADLVLPG